MTINFAHKSLPKALTASFSSITETIPFGVLCPCARKCVSSRLISDDVSVVPQLPIFNEPNSKKILLHPVILGCQARHAVCSECKKNLEEEKKDESESLLACPFCFEKFCPNSLKPDERLEAICQWFFSLFGIEPAEPQTSIGSSFDLSLLKNKIFLPKSKYKIALLGGTGSGKSSLLFRFLKDKFEEKDAPTLEAFYKHTIIFDREECELEILDTSGDSGYANLKPKWYEFADGYIFVFSIDSSNTFEELSVYLNELLKYRKENPPSLILVGTASDKEDDRQILPKQAKKLAAKMNCDYWETSALNGTNTIPVFQALVKKIKQDKILQLEAKREKFFKKMGVKKNDPTWGKPPKQNSVWKEDNIIDQDPPLIVPWIKHFHVELGSKNYKKDQKVLILDVEEDIKYYTDILYKTKHFNAIAGDSENPVVISVEKIEKGNRRELIRTKQEDMLISVPANISKEDAKQVYKMLLPNIDFSNLKKDESPELQQELITLEKLLEKKTYKIGVIYCKENQTKEYEMLANTTGSEDFLEFLSFLGEKIELSKWDGFRGGLDSTRDGEYSIFAKWHSFQVMFHVSTLLSSDPQDPKQISKKRHIGNDCVVIIFKEGNSPFVPTVIKSNFVHVICVIQKVKENKGIPQYKVALCCKENVPPYPPFIPYPPIFEKNTNFRDWLYTKLINGERASDYSPDFFERKVKSKQAALNGIIEKRLREEKK